MEKRYRERLAEIERERKRAARLSIGIFACFVVAVASVIGVVVYESMKGAEVDRRVAALESLKAANKYDEVKSEIDNLPPDAAKDKRVAEVKSWAEEQIASEKKRRKGFDDAIAVIKKSIADKSPGDDVEEAVKQAKNLARNEDEKKDADEEARKYAQMQIDLQQDTDAKFVAEVGKLKEQAIKIASDSEAKPEPRIEKLHGLQGELDALERKSQASEAAKRPVGELRNEIKSLIAKCGKEVESLGLEEEITAACGDSATLAKRLADYAEKSPTSPHSASFRAVAGEEQPLWDWIGQWNETVRATGRVNCFTLDANSAGGLAAPLRKLLADRRGHPDADDFQERLLYLDAIAQRVDSEGPIETRLKSILTGPLMEDVWMLAASDGRRYYLPQDPAELFKRPVNDLQPGTPYGFDYYDLWSNPDSKKHTSLPGSDINPSTGKPAPQCATGKTVVAILEKVAEKGWEKSFCEMMETVRNDKDGDPLLRRFLLRRILAVGSQGSRCLQNGYRGVHKVLNDSQVPPSVNWVNPLDRTAGEQRPLAEAELAKLPAAAELNKEMAAEWKKLNRPIGSEYACVGWLRKNSEKSWQCVMKPGGPPSGELCVVRFAAPGDKSAAAFDPVGEIKEGKAELNKAAPGPALVDGRPVYCVVRPPK